MLIQENIGDIFDKLVHFIKPILFVHGECDFLPDNPENVRRLSERISSSHLHILKDAGHMFFNREIWDELSYIILQHISK